MNRFITMLHTHSSSARSFVLLRATSAVAAATLTACAGYNPGALQPGSSEADLRARMGEPSGRHTLPGGASKLEFARGPMGKHTYMVELDADGRVRGWQQVLTEANFDALPIAAPRAEVRQQLGRPSESRVGWRGVGEVWSYRFESPFCRWFQVWLVDERVREASYAIDPMCEEARREGD